MGRMGFSKPEKLPPPTPPPPPVRATGQDIVDATDEARRRRMTRRGYESTMRPAMSLLGSAPQTTAPQGNRTLLGP